MNSFKIIFILIKISLGINTIVNIEAVKISGGSYINDNTLAGV